MTLNQEDWKERSPDFSAWTQSLSSAPDVRAYIPIQNSELEFRARIQSLDSGPGFRAKI